MKKLFLILIIATKLYSSSVEVLIFNYPPLQGSSNVSDLGLIPEVIQEAFKENNITVKFRILPTLRGVEEIKKGSNLAMVGVYENFDLNTHKYLKMFPVIHMDFVFFYNKRLLNQFQYKKNDDLKKYSIGVLLNGSTHTYAKSINLNTEGVTSLEAMFKKVNLGRNQLAISEYLSGLYTIQIIFPKKKEEWVAYTEKPFLSTVGGVVFNKNHKDYAKYEPLFRNGLVKIVKNGKWEKIVKKYYPNNRIDPKSVELMKDFVNEN